MEVTGRPKGASVMNGNTIQICTEDILCTEYFVALDRMHAVMVVIVGEHQNIRRIKKREKRR